MHLSKDELLEFRNNHGMTHAELSRLLYPTKDQRAMVTKLKSYETGDQPIPRLEALAIQQIDFQLKQKKAKKRGRSKFQFIDLFAGIGGIRMAFERAGGSCVFTSEWNKYAAKMYEDNFGERPAGDITKIKAEDIPKHDVLLAGFPCQPFSVAGVSKKQSLGRKHGFEDKTQGTLFFDVARIIKHHKPRMFMLENVKNLKSHDGGKTFEVIMETLREDLGYTVNYQIVDARTEVPQQRQRIYIVGTRDGEPFKFPKFGGDDKKLKEILQKPREVTGKYTITDGVWRALQRHAENHRSKGNGFGYGLVGPEDVARTLSARYYKDGAEILIKQKNKNPRRLSPLECARLMGFPDDFRISISDTQAYKCFGNSVVVPVVEKIAKKMAREPILKELSKLKQTEIDFD